MPKFIHKKEGYKNRKQPVKTGKDNICDNVKWHGTARIDRVQKFQAKEYVTQIKFLQSLKESSPIFFNLKNKTKTKTNKNKNKNTKHTHTQKKPKQTNKQTNKKTLWRFFCHKKAKIFLITITSLTAECVLMVTIIKLTQLHNSNKQK